MSLLHGMQVFNRELYKTRREVLRQNLEIVNAASGGVIQLIDGSRPIQGDFETETFFPQGENIIQSRNPYGNAPVDTKTFSQDIFNTVKVARRTDNLKWTGAQFDWINQNEALAGAYWGAKIAEQSFSEMVNLSLAILQAALANDSASILTDISGLVAPANVLNLGSQINAVSKFGDKSEEIVTWIMHSAPYHNLWGQNVNNNNRLFKWGNIKIMEDALGKRMLMTDSPYLFDGTVNPVIFNTLGLTRGAITIEINNDYRDLSWADGNTENITYFYKAEWSFNLRVKGYSWNKNDENKAPTDAALLSSANWIRKVTSVKDLPGVILRSN